MSPHITSQRINAVIQQTLHATFLAAGLKAPVAYAKVKANIADATKLFHAKVKEHKRGKTADVAAMKLAMRDVTTWARQAQVVPTAKVKQAPRGKL